MSRTGRKFQKKQTLDLRMKHYRIIYPDAGDNTKQVTHTIEAVKNAFYEGEQERFLSWPEFLFQQAGYIRKRWWLGQILVLVMMWWLLQTSGSSRYVQRSVGVLASVFAVMLIPELWKNRSNQAMEIEGASYFSLRQIYAARMFLFAIVDVLLLAVFFGAAATTARMTIWEAVTQFFLPFNVTCCICFQVLCSRRFGSEYTALGLCMLWAAVWESVVLREEIYHVVQDPAWVAAVVLSVFYLIFVIWKTLKTCTDGYEVYHWQDISAG